MTSFSEGSRRAKYNKDFIRIWGRSMQASPLEARYQIAATILENSTQPSRRLKKFSSRLTSIKVRNPR